MKSRLRFSIFLNFLLAAGLASLLLKASHLPAQQAASKTAEIPVTTNRTITATQAVSKVEPPPFNWSQLDASDYHFYVKNLRNIGCPEPTLRAIVTADVHSAYHYRTQTLEKKLAGLNTGTWSNQIASLDTQKSLQAKLQKLPGEEIDTINDFLGLKPSPVENAPAFATSGQRPRPAGPVVSPLVLQTIDPATLNFSSEQQQVINDLRQKFEDEIGGPDQDVNDPAYLERWRKAQPEADDMLRGMLGAAVYQNYQLAAANSEATTKP